jgi:hypothetical protein
MKSKKTVSVDYIKTWINAQLAHPNYTPEEKLGFIATIETILHKANAYKGFMYLELEPGNVPPALGTEKWVSRKYF